MTALRCHCGYGTHRHVGLCSDGTHSCQDRFDLAAVEVDPIGGGDDRLRMFELDDVVGGDAAAVTVGSADHFGGGDQGHLGAWAHAPSTDPERTCSSRREPGAATSGLAHTPPSQ